MSRPQPHAAKRGKSCTHRPLWPTDWRYLPVSTANASPGANPAISSTDTGRNVPRAQLLPKRSDKRGALRLEVPGQYTAVIAGRQGQRTAGARHVDDARMWQNLHLQTLMRGRRAILARFNC